jgi:hypothetical protein
MEVGSLELVAVDHADFADAGAGEILEYGDAQAAAADYQYSAGAESGLASFAYFLEGYLAGVVGLRFCCALCA